MGRPLNKKYFGNRNTGSPTTAGDDGIGGKSVASIPVTTASSYTVRPVVTLTGAPNLLKGEPATATITSQVNTISAFVGGTNYTAGDTFTIGNGTVFTVGTVTLGVIQTITTTSRGSFPYADGALITGPRTTTIISAANPLATGATVTLTYNAKSVVVTPGSGYTTTVPTAAATQSVVLGTVVMTTPVGNTATTGSGFNPEPAIIASAYTGSSAKQADIIKQVSTYRYKVRTSDGIFTAKLTSVAAAAPGSDGINQMTIKATDLTGCTYYVQKLTSRKAVIFPYGLGTHEFPLNADGTAKRVQWTLGTAVLNTSVTIENG